MDITKGRAGGLSLNESWAGGKARHRQLPPRGKVEEDISKMRMIPKGTDALSPALCTVTPFEKKTK